MSGTPAPNHSGELYTILRTLKPEAIFFPKSTQPMTIQAFEDRYCTVAVKRFGDRQVRVIEGSRNINELRTHLAGFMIRKTKAQVLKDLPPMRFDTIPVSPKGMDVNAYADIIDPAMSDEDVLRALKRNRMPMSCASVPPSVPRRWMVPSSISRNGSATTRIRRRWSGHVAAP